MEIPIISTEVLDNGNRLKFLVSDPGFTLGSAGQQVTLANAGNRHGLNLNGTYVIRARSRTQGKSAITIVTGREFNALERMKLPGVLASATLSAHSTTVNLDNTTQDTTTDLTDYTDFNTTRTTIPMWAKVAGVIAAIGLLWYAFK